MSLGKEVMSMLNEADTRAKLIDPKLQRSGWTEEMIEREKVITKGMIINDSGDRLPARRPDYILYYPDKNGIPLAIIEAEAEDKSHLAGMQQAKEYMERLNVPFAYSTNGHKIEEYDDFRKVQTTLENFPSPSELWNRYVEGKELKEIKEKDPLLYPYYPFPDKPIRYYQEVAVRNAIEAILKGRKKVLLTMATGSGKTYVAFQIAWKLYRPFIMRRLVRAGYKPVHAAEEIEKRSEIAKQALLAEMEIRPVIFNRAPTLHKFNMMAAFPVLTKSKVLQVSPPIAPTIAGDHDGDAMNLHVPVTEEARREVIAKMLPSKNLLSIREFTPHYVPRQEYLLGLYLATRPPKGKKVYRFKSVDEALKAYYNGIIDLNTPIEIG